MKDRMKVMIVEGNQEYSERCVELLTEKGYEVITAPKDGNVLLRMICEVQPKVVLANLFMRGMDAIGVMKAVREKALPEFPQFLLTVPYSNPILEAEMLEAGAQFCFPLPFDPDQMATWIVRLTSPAHARDRIAIQSAPAQQVDLEVLVTDIIHQIGVPAHIKGYHYVRSSIMLSVQNPEIINSVTKQLYPTVAKQFDTTPSRVERAIRHAIEVAWDRGDVDVLNDYFGYTVHNGRGKPTNSEFVAMIADKLRLQLKDVNTTPVEQASV